VAGAEQVPVRPAKRSKRSGGRRGPGRLIALIAAAVVLLAAIPAVLLYRSATGDRLTETVNRDELVPLSFKHPGSWNRQEAGINVVFSPADGALTSLFSQKGTGDSWSQVREVIGGDGDKAIGLATSFSSTLVDVSTPEQIKASLQGLLPANATFTSGPEQLLVGGYAADQVEGDLTDPADPANKLHFRAVVVQVQRPDPRTVYLVFFAPQSSFDSKRELFDQVQASANFLA
jgi:hypothetical protein